MRTVLDGAQFIAILAALALASLLSDTFSFHHPITWVLGAAGIALEAYLMRGIYSSKPRDPS